MLMPPSFESPHMASPPSGLMLAATFGSESMLGTRARGAHRVEDAGDVDVGRAETSSPTPALFFRSFHLSESARLAAGSSPAVASLEMAMTSPDWRHRTERPESASPLKRWPSGMSSTLTSGASPDAPAP